MSKSFPQATKSRLRLGIYGGTFDPVHLGHLILASDAREQLNLDAVLFVPCAQSPHKTAAKITPAKKRLTLLRKALQDNPLFWVSRCEVDRPAPSYAIDTAQEIHEAFPHATLFWLIGQDQLPQLKTWHRYSDLRKLVTFAVVPRGDSPLKRLPTGVIRLPHARRIDISASEIRDRVSKKLPINHLVPAPVAAYIHRTQLYC